MRILLLGATGMVGSRIAVEALRRGHDVTAVSRSGRSPDSVHDTEPEAVLASVAADVTDREAVAQLAEGHDAVVSALAPPRDGSEPTQPFLAAYRSVIEGVREAGVGRLVVVGGAGSLEAAPGRELVDTPGFPTAYKPEARAHRDLLVLCRSVVDLDWTYISPAAEIAPGERTGRFRVGGDRLLTDTEGNSRISAEDYAVALVDELEQDAHPRTRICVAY
ncbi:NAD(P)H-binding protein [Streptomyces sp. HNM0574]|uniref:NAD(P)-dependent oxidoreductase n=1 Tax=Streptomyces sp. HNM0574 TaxID=2714954 RepID=UPI00146C86BE|nr:NAD(P)H-binding protein [Streptomyces sp. HNM0574]NLU68691.1 NAD(P)H-binding protein [Streptomyces sp. HNM0574]